MNYCLWPVTKTMVVLMAGDQDNGGVINYPRAFLANQLGCLHKTLDEVLAVLETTNRITINGNEITIVNWFKYQPPTTNKYHVHTEKPRPPLPEVTDLVLSSAIKCYEDNIGLATPHVFEELEASLTDPLR